MMEVKQAVEILGQAIDMSVAGGAFKAARDVTVVNQALGIVANFVAEHTSEQESIGPGPEKKLEKVAK